MIFYNKIYKIINGVGTLSLNISRSKDAQFIRFQPNFGKQIGFYITNDPLIQYKIERHSSFGKKFVLYDKIPIEPTKRLKYLQKQAETLEQQAFGYDDETSQLSLSERTLSKLTDLEKRVQFLERKLGVNTSEVIENKEPVVEDIKSAVNKEEEARKLQLEAEKLMDKTTKVESVKTVQEGKNYIISYASENNISIERRGMTSLQAVQNKALGLGLEFPNMK